MARGVSEQFWKGKDRVDHLFRISLKAYIENDKGEVLVVKETGRNFWDLPGGGMDHGEDIQVALKRELKEEIGYDGEFEHEILSVDEPHLLMRDIWMVRLVFRVIPEKWEFSLGTDGDELKFIDPYELTDSESGAERLVFFYNRLAHGDKSYDPKMPTNEKDDKEKS